MGKLDQSPVSEVALDSLIVSAVKTLERVRLHAKNPMIAYSGGKDSIAVGLIMELAGLKWPMICETSFYFTRAVQDIEALAQARGWDLRRVVSLDWGFVRAHPHIVFSDDSKVRGWTFSRRHQKSMKVYAATHGHDVQVFGRRTQENSVRAMIYNTSAGTQCHPLRDWKTNEVWALLRRFGVTAPWIYSTRFGELEGNAPFYTLRAKDVGGMANAWALAESLDPQYHPGQLK